MTHSLNRILNPKLGWRLVVVAIALALVVALPRYEKHSLSEYPLTYGRVTEKSVEQIGFGRFRAWDLAIYLDSGIRLYVRRDHETDLKNILLDLEEGTYVKAHYVARNSNDRGVELELLNLETDAGLLFDYRDLMDKMLLTGQIAGVMSVISLFIGLVILVGAQLGKRLFKVR